MVVSWNRGTMGYPKLDGLYCKNLWIKDNEVPPCQETCKWHQHMEMDSTLFLFTSHTRPWVLDVDEFCVTTPANLALLRLYQRVHWRDRSSFKLDSGLVAWVLDIGFSFFVAWADALVEAWENLSGLDSRPLAWPPVHLTARRAHGQSTSFLEVGDTTGLPKLASSSVELWFSRLL